MVAHVTDGTLDHVVLVNVQLCHPRLFTRCLPLDFFVVDQQVFKAFLCPNGTAVVADQIGCEVDGGAARTGDDPVIIDVALVDQHFRIREALHEFLANCEMHGTAAPIEQAGLAEHERAGAEGNDGRLGGMQFAQQIEQPFGRIAGLAQQPPRQDDVVVFADNAQGFGRRHRHSTTGSDRQVVACHPVPFAEDLLTAERLVCSKSERVDQASNGHKGELIHQDETDAQVWLHGRVYALVGRRFV
ncbi:hypothetical protein FQZ97_373000 [compost metagenome]